MTELLEKVAVELAGDFDCPFEHPAEYYFMTKFRNRSITRKAKRDRQEYLSEKYAQEMRKSKMSARDAERLGEAKAKLELNMQDALHNQDMAAEDRM